MELWIRRCLHYGFRAIVVQVAGADIAGQALIRQAETQILQARLRPNRVVRTNVIAGPNCIDRGRLWPTMSSTSDIGEPAGRAEPGLAETTPTSSLDTDRL